MQPLKKKLNVLRSNTCPCCKEKFESNKYIKITRASKKDAKAIKGLIEKERGKGALLLTRTTSSISKNYFIARNGFDEIVGIIGLKNWNGGEGVELISHIVKQRFQGKGIGTILLERAVREVARILPHPTSIFVVTTKVDYYLKFDFELANSKSISAKVATDCAKCPKGLKGPGHPPCPEVLMEYKGELFSTKKHRSSC